VSFLGGPVERDPVFCERRCKFNPNGICQKKTQTRITETYKCQFFQREIPEDDADE